MMRLWRKEVVNEFQLNQLKQVFFFSVCKGAVLHYVKASFYSCVIFWHSVIFWPIWLLMTLIHFQRRRFHGCKSLHVWTTRQWRHSWLTHQFTSQTRCPQNLEVMTVFWVIAGGPVLSVWLTFDDSVKKNAALQVISGSAPTDLATVSYKIVYFVLRILTVSGNSRQQCWLVEQIHSIISPT